MGFRINTNVAAMTALNNAKMNNRNLDSSLGKLSSGLRINTAADDASGLSIANSLRAQASSLGQAVSNGNDAIGLVQTADGALSEYSNILDTIKTKSVQAASDTQNTASRLAIQKDIDKLMEELNTIATTTSFNGQKLLSGSFVNKEFQMGANANESVTVNIASAETNNIGQTTRATLEVGQLGENQLSLTSATTGKSLTLAAVDIQNNNNPQNGMGAIADSINRYSGETGITAKAVVEVTTNTISAGTTGSDFAINGINIGAINVSANDSEGTLLTAINSKTTQTGVTASKTEDGRLSLASTDGRTISVTGDVAVTGKTADELSTIGNLEVVQVGSSAFQITGSDLGAAVGADIVSKGDINMIQDSVLSIGSIIGISSTLTEGTKLGVQVTATIGMSLVVDSSTADMTLAVGSVLGSGSILNKDTVVASTISLSSSAALSSDMFVKAGSVFTSGTLFDSGTVLSQDITVAGTTYSAGSTLQTDLTLTATVVLANDMTIHRDSLAANSSIASGSTLLAGTVLGADIHISSDSVLSSEMTLKAGSLLGTSSQMAVGSVLGQSILITAAALAAGTAETELKVGSILNTGSTIKAGSSLGGATILNANITLTEDMSVRAGSVLATGTILKAGTVIAEDLTAAQAGNANVGIKAGTVLGSDLTLTASVYTNKDMTIIKGEGTAATIFAGSTIAANGGNQNSVTMSNTSFTNLSDIDVTTLDGAMKAIDTVGAAIGNLDAIRSELGSTQNQVTSTINNISVTQVNVKAAESNIRDVDFAAESANFSKFNILAQSGSYAMSQANAVQQNVMRLLQ